jgi:site-specific recombinase XerC
MAQGPQKADHSDNSLIYKATGNLRAVQILLGHTNIENTVRYLGVDIDDALTLSERTDI